MSLLLAWLVFPVLLAILALGAGLALERAAVITLPGCLVIPAGLAAIVLIGQLATMTDATAELAAPVTVLVAATGFALSPPWEQRSRLDGWALAAAAGVFAIFAAPVVLSGSATFAGFLKLDDTVAFVAIVDHIMEHGRNLDRLVPSSYETSLAVTLGNGYPVGSFVPLGIGARLLDHDPLWLVQPWLSFLAAMLALTLNALLSEVVASPRRRALCAFVAAQPALLVGYAMWGGIKELATAWTIALVVALVPTATRPARARAAVVLACAVAATLAIASVAGGIWIAPAILLALIAAARRSGMRSTIRLGGGLAGVGLALALPSLTLARTFLHELFSPGVLWANAQVGHLPGRISALQVFGVWPTNDFRFWPELRSVTLVLILTVAVATVVGAVTALRRRAWSLLVYGAGTAVAGLAISAYSGPWVAAKALAIAAPAILVLSCAGVAAMWQAGRRLESGVAASLIAGGVLWSNALGYQGVNLAPRAQLDELARIGHLAAGRGPTLITEHSPYGTRHLLRDGAAEGVSDLRRRWTLLRSGDLVPQLGSADTDELQLDGLLTYRTLVLRQSPAASRPPATYRRIWRGRTYEVWQRPRNVVRPLVHLPLGWRLAAGATPRCADVRRLAVLAGAEGRLASVERSAPAIMRLGTLSRPAGWWADPAKPNIVLPTTSGALAGRIEVGTRGRYDIWIAGSARGLLTASIDGRKVGAVRGVLNSRGAYMLLGNAVPLAAGLHAVLITYRDGGLRPGSGGQDTNPFTIGPLVASAAPERRLVTSISAAEWRSLCGKRLDWIEVSRPAGRSAPPR